mmetsp:Transcript_89291/g.255702  ORF Transcript_89291/g.255702 Transcript_89291/m.255702 type:complete len:262 (-) Transcript_89291:300-1085(-)
MAGELELEGLHGLLKDGELLLALKDGPDVRIVLQSPQLRVEPKQLLTQTCHARNHVPLLGLFGHVAGHDRHLRSLLVWVRSVQAKTPRAFHQSGSRVVPPLLAFQGLVATKHEDFRSIASRVRGSQAYAVHVLDDSGVGVELPLLAVRGLQAGPHLHLATGGCRLRRVQAATMLTPELPERENLLGIGRHHCNCFLVVLDLSIGRGHLHVKILSFGLQVFDLVDDLVQHVLVGLRILREQKHPRPDRDAPLGVFRNKFLGA